MLINISGSLLVGFITGLVLFGGASSTLRTVLATGFCGGYATFSAASFETVRLAQRGRAYAALVSAFGTLVVCVLAAAASIAVAHA